MLKMKVADGLDNLECTISYYSKYNTVHITVTVNDNELTMNENIIFLKLL